MVSSMNPRATSLAFFFVSFPCSSVLVLKTNLKSTTLVLLGMSRACTSSQASSDTRLFTSVSMACRHLSASGDLMASASVSGSLAAAFASPSTFPSTAAVMASKGAAGGGSSTSGAGGGGMSDGSDAEASGAPNGSFPSCVSPSPATWSLLNVTWIDETKRFESWA